MRKTYRIKEIADYYRTEYVVQRRSLFGLFWYNPDNIDGYTTGYYRTLEEANSIIEAKLFKAGSCIV